MDIVDKGFAAICGFCVIVGGILIFDSLLLHFLGIGLLAAVSNIVSFVVDVVTWPVDKLLNLLGM